MTKKAAERPVTRRRDLFKDATEDFIAAMENGNAPWDHKFMPAPRNALTGRQYNGVNFVALMATPFEDPRWISFKQAKDNGWNVKKGSAATRVYFYKQIDAPVTGADGQEGEEKNAQPAVKQIPYLQSFCLFNAEQVENVPELETVRTEDVNVFSIARNLEVVIEYEDIPEPRFAENVITLPDNFTDQDSHDAGLLSALTRWAIARPENRTGFTLPAPDAVHPQMLESMIRLRAQLASIMLSSEFGLPIHKIATPEDTANWARIMREDKRALFTASRDAWRACDLIAQNAPLPDFMLENEGTDEALPATLFADAQLVPEKARMKP